MSQSFEYLFSPLQIRHLTVPNRVVFSAHVTNFPDQNHLPTERQLHYYAERARGGAGMIVIGGSIAHPSSVLTLWRNLVFDERSIPMYRRITDAVHEFGTVILTQVYNVGSEMTSLHTRRPVLAPSPIPCPSSRETPKEMEPEDIEMLLEAIAKSARNAKEGGFDGIEFISSQGLLMGQFMSLHTNKRTDEYGGSQENRLRYPLQAIERVRKEVGENFLIGFKISGDDFTPGGLTLEDATAIAERLAATGNVDYLHTCCGTFYSMETIVPDMSFPPGCMVYMAARVREVVNIPVVAIKRIQDPIQAERILADGHADLIGMSRSLICDPEWPKKAREGRIEEIRACVACDQGCMDRYFKGIPITCTQNPAVGKEREWGMGTIKPAEKKKRVLVVGGGPAGMKAAETAAQRGHQVALYEKEDRLGGQVNLLTRVASREEFNGVTRNLCRQLERLGVEIHLSAELTADRIREMNPDALVIATGSIPLRTGYSSGQPDLPGIPGADRDHVLTAWEVLKGEREIGERVVIIEDEGEIKALSVAEFLAEQGKQVEILTGFPFVGMDVNPCVLEPQYQRLYQKGVTLTPFTRVKEITERSVIAYQIYSRVEREIAVDQVVLVMGNAAHNGLYRSLKGQVKEIYAVGDCVAPRKVVDAIYEGQGVGLSL
ncbi:MAG: FAD-dependent oxidoreductase [Candidatus Tectomicrobia bacterium]|uniref:FAD-dependent oxidoreductase n=1 Tax=Tectimicrobiota bacterium TaxID=2528274 RepID=A0A932CLY4_UNCTE|nr:FAD-dependent oxidoreductase [Candidatus Tectomicrobia bacterium]